MRRPLHGELGGQPGAHRIEPALRDFGRLRQRRRALGQGAQPVVRQRLPNRIAAGPKEVDIARGFVLSCQSFPVTDKVVIDFDQAE